jgi:urea transport system substrate-binding protein
MKRHLTLILVVGALLVALGCTRGETRSIKVGVLHSTSGTMSTSETPVQEATLLAIEEINARGGLLGHRLEPILADGGSNPDQFAEGAERLVQEESVAVLFGCWTSASRKSVIPVVRRNNHLLFYPVQYEGVEQSPYVVYTGATPNQQLVPGVKWAFDNLGKRFFLVGSDYVYPHVSNKIARTQIEALGGEVVGEEYLILGNREVAPVVQKIADTKPDIILNTLNGDVNKTFFKALRDAGIHSQDTPTMSLSLAESSLTTMDIQDVVGDYASWSYFGSIDSEPNKKFVRAFKRKYGADRVTDDPMEAAYIGVHLWAQAVEQAGSWQAAEVRATIGDQSLSAPEGIVSIDPVTQHTWKTVRVGQIQDTAQFDTVWTSHQPICPRPFPGYRSRAAWDQYLMDLYNGWGKSWSNSPR